MTESDIGGRDNAYRQLKTTLEEISGSFKEWSKAFSQNSAESRMSATVSAAVDQYSNFATQTILGSLTKISMDRLVSSERYISQSFRDLDLPSVRDLNEMERVLQWVEATYVMDLDPIHFDPDAVADPAVSQQTHKIHRAQIDLQYTLEKEKQQQHLERSLSEALAKLDSISMDPGELEAIRSRLNDQSNQFDSWRLRSQELEAELLAAEKKLKDTSEELKDTQNSLAELEAKSLRASESFEAAQARYDMVSERTSADKLVEHFQGFRDKHNKAQRLSFASGIVFLILVAGLSIAFAWHSMDKPIDPAAVPLKLAIAAGGGAIGTYLLRLATYHRRLTVWADTMQVQLQTFASYSEQIGDEGSKNQLRAEFAKRVFGDEPGRPSSSSDSSGDSISASDLSTIIANLTRVQPK